MWRVLEQKLTDETLIRKVEVHPLVENMPGPIKKVLGDRFGYVEEGTLDRKKQSLPLSRDSQRDAGQDPTSRARCTASRSVTTASSASWSSTSR